MSDTRFTLYLGNFPVRHYASKASAMRTARAVAGEGVSVVERDTRYPFTHRRSWKVSR